MIYLIAGTTHTGKTLLAQKLIETCHYPCISIDHLKMGLIRSGLCLLSPEDSEEELTAFLWPVVREMIKTAIENGQNMIVEGCYIPFCYQEDFAADYLSRIRFYCLIFSENYIKSRFHDIIRYENRIEQRQDSLAGYLSQAEFAAENARNLAECQRYRQDYILIDEEYDADAYVRRIVTAQAESGGRS